MTGPLKKTYRNFKVLKMLAANRELTFSGLCAAFPAYKGWLLRKFLAELDVSQDRNGKFIIPDYRLAQLAVEDGREPDEPACCGVAAAPNTIDLMHRPPMRCQLAVVLRREADRLRVK